MACAWVLLLRGGGVVRGAGEAPAAGLALLAREAEAAMFSVPGAPPLFVAGGCEFMTTVAQAAGEAPRRHWSWRALDPAARFWCFHEGRITGLGPSVEAVAWAARALEAASAAALRR